MLYVMASEMISTRLPFVWDYDLDEDQFRRLLSGTLTIGRLDRTWAAVRLLEYAPYREIVRLMGFRELVRGWPQWRSHIRSESRKRGFDFLAAWFAGAATADFNGSGTVTVQDLFDFIAAWFGGCG